MATHDDEPSLLARSRDGDLDAFNTLVERHQRSVFNLCLRMLGSTQAAEDATQEAFISAFRSIKSLRGAGFRAWLARIAANACYDELRRRRSRPAVSLDEPVHPDELPADVASGEPTPAEQLDRADQWRRFTIQTLTVERYGGDVEPVSAAENYTPPVGRPTNAWLSSSAMSRGSTTRRSPRPPAPPWVP